MRDGLIEIYRVVAEPDRRRADRRVSRRRRIGQPAAGQVPPSADRIAARAVAIGSGQTQQDDLDGGGVLLRTAVPIRQGRSERHRRGGRVALSWAGRPGVGRSRRRLPTRVTRALRVLQGPLQGIYQSVFLAVSLLILISATWLGLYLAKRITRPVQMLAEGARAIGAGQFDLRLEPETSDELGSLVESFNMMAAQLRSSRTRLEAVTPRARTEECRSRRATSLHRDHSRARGHGGHFARHGRPDFDRQRRGRAAPAPWRRRPMAAPPPRSSNATTCGRCCGWRGRPRNAGGPSRPSRK